MLAKLPRIDAPALAVSASVIVHAVFLLLFFLSLKTSQPMPETPVVNVELTSPWWDRKPPPRERQRAISPGGATFAQPAIEQPTPEVEPRVIDPAPELAAGERMRRTLRQALGCQHARLAGLTVEERQRCQDKLAVLGKAEEGMPEPKLRLDKGGAFDTDDTPYLARKPKNGCKVGVGGKADAMGKEGAVAGFNCAWSF